MNLLNNVKGKLKPLALQHGDDVVKENGKMLMSVSEGNHNGHLYRQA